MRTNSPTLLYLKPTNNMHSSDTRSSSLRPSYHSSLPPPMEIFPFPFLSLPPEIRLLVYECVLTSVLLHVWRKLTQGFRWKPCLSFDRDKLSCIRLGKACNHTTSFEKLDRTSEIWKISAFALMSTCTTIKFEMKESLFRYAHVSINIRDIPLGITYLRTKGLHRPDFIHISGTYYDDKITETSQECNLQEDESNDLGPALKTRQLVENLFPTLRSATLQIRCSSLTGRKWKEVVRHFEYFEQVGIRQMRVWDSNGISWLMSRPKNIKRVNCDTFLVEMTWSIQR